MAEVSRKVLGWRLRLMPYLYSAFYDSHARGCPVARPLFFVFPGDATTLLLREQWMMGAPSGAAGSYVKASQTSDRNCMCSIASARLLSVFLRFYNQPKKALSASACVCN